MYDNSSYRYVYVYMYDKHRENKKRYPQKKQSNEWITEKTKTNEKLIVHMFICMSKEDFVQC
jgi:hypothetical protein